MERRLRGPGSWRQRPRHRSEDAKHALRRHRIRWCVQEHGRRQHVERGGPTRRCEGPCPRLRSSDAEHGLRRDRRRAGGVFKSTDGGTSWTATELTRSIDAFVFDPTTPGTVYAAGAGVFKSTNGGGGWSASNTGLTVDLPVTAFVSIPSCPARCMRGRTAASSRAPTAAGAGAPPSRARQAAPTPWPSIPARRVRSTPENFLHFPRTLSGRIQEHGRWQHVERSTRGPDSWWRQRPRHRSQDTHHALRSERRRIQEHGRWQHVERGLRGPDSWWRQRPRHRSEDAHHALRGRGRRRLQEHGRGGTWSDASAGLAGGVIALVIDPKTPTTLYADTDSGVFRSIDSGASWGSSNFPVLPIFDPASPTTLYAGRDDAGVFKSTDAGDTWSTINTGLPNTIVRTLAIDPITPGTLYAGTDSGVFRFKRSLPALATATAMVRWRSTSC